ncbi:hypothetical protein NLI96_g2974 [Meripilus lineatus]|uniref:Uncharacterized protein n=1 Tax=Meripilus lineatus TaxID=2056292 RepID=A0AAD5V9V0_9APHY|nr:hypothetical protein NLI96_g2974 [Physisporinus lineatus]
MDTNTILEDVTKGANTVSQVEKTLDVASGRSNSHAAAEIMDETSSVTSVDSEEWGDVGGFIPKGPPAPSVNSAGFTLSEEEKRKRKEQKKIKAEEEKKKAAEGGK